MRCKRCDERWETSTWSDSAWRYARCPRCYRQDLTYWNESHYSPPLSVRLFLALGAKHIRCAACRYNFASFKPRKERFAWKHEERVPVQDEQDSEIEQR